MAFHRHNSRPKAPVHSCLYECRVMHHRLSPRKHRFEYGIFMIQIDLDELGTCDRTLRLLGHNRRAVYGFRDSDHLAYPPSNPGPTLKASLSAWLADQGVHLPPDARVRLVTLPRVLGYVFNPVSFYFCSTANGTPIAAVAEVGNTFGELKPFLIPGSGSQDRFRRTVPKHFYVSPFSDLRLCFEFDLRTPDERLDIRILDVTEQGETVLVSTLQGRRHPLTDRQLARMGLKYPLVTLHVITLIHWQALRLWWKRLPWHAKSANPDLQRDVLRPHASIAGTRPVPPMPPMPVPVQVPSPSLSKDLVAS
ncbi:MAG: DUF1365 domain-containing protein [Verrucomicrobiota bacterium]